MPIDQVHPFETNVAIGEGHDQDWCAHRYAEDIRADGPDPNDDGWPVFDLILLGVGPDGHIMSVFPDSRAFDSSEWALGIPAPTTPEYKPYTVFTQENFFNDQTEKVLPQTVLADKGMTLDQIGELLQSYGVRSSSVTARGPHHRAAIAVDLRCGSPD